jgi:phage shock protein PspC (stress-responsive transcriptional regulator)
MILCIWDYKQKSTLLSQGGFYFLGMWRNYFKFALPNSRNNMIQLKDLVERHAFGVCSYLGEKMNIASSRVRLYFIYISFVTLGSPVIFYLFLAFWVNIRRYVKRHKDAFFG